MVKYSRYFEPQRTSGITFCVENRCASLRLAKKHLVHVDTNGKQKADRQNPLQAETNSTASCKQLVAVDNRL